MSELLRMEYGKNASRRAENLFDIEKVKRLYAGLYLQYLRQRKHS